MNCSLQHTTNGHFSRGISPLRALGPKIMGNILQHSCVTFPLVLTGGMCPKSGCIHEQSELDITEAPNEHSGFIPSNDPPREQAQLFTHLCAGKYLQGGRSSWNQRYQNGSVLPRAPSSDRGSPAHALSTRFRTRRLDGSWSLERVKEVK